MARARVFPERGADGVRRWRVTIDGGATLDATGFADPRAAARFAGFMAEHVSVALGDGDEDGAAGGDANK